METQLLTAQNPGFIISSREEKMNAEILKVVLSPPLPDQPLELVISDENGFLLYKKILIPKPRHPDDLPVHEQPEVPVNKRFIFNGELRVQIMGPECAGFRVEVQYV